MARDLSLSCHCGEVQGQVAGVSPRTVMRATCYCADCRAFLKHTGAVGCANDQGGAELVITLPGRIRFDAGESNLRVLRLSKKGPLRWYAGCCGTPMGNIVPRHVIRFASVPLSVFDEVERGALGPLRGSLNAKYAPDGTSPPADFGLRRFQWRVLTHHWAAALGLAPSGTPYLNADKSTIAPVEKLTDEERARAYA